MYSTHQLTHIPGQQKFARPRITALYPKNRLEGLQTSRIRDAGMRKNASCFMSIGDVSGRETSYEAICLKIAFCRSVCLQVDLYHLKRCVKKSVSVSEMISTTGKEIDRYRSTWLPHGLQNLSSRQFDVLDVVTPFRRTWCSTILSKLYLRIGSRLLLSELFSVRHLERL